MYVHVCALSHCLLGCVDVSVFVMTQLHRRAAVRAAGAAADHHTRNTVRADATAYTVPSGAALVNRAVNE